MRLFIMRHGEAVNRAESDAARPLSKAGHREVASMVQRYWSGLSTANTIWSSPYTRARETATLVAGQLRQPFPDTAISSNVTSSTTTTSTATSKTAAHSTSVADKPVIIQPWLAPTDNPDQVLKVLATVEQTILLVSHQPLVSILIDTLAGLEPGRHRMGTAAVACLEADVMAPGCAELVWLEHPHQ